MLFFFIKGTIKMYVWPFHLIVKLMMMNVLVCYMFTAFFFCVFLLLFLCVMENIIQSLLVYDLVYGFVCC